MYNRLRVVGVMTAKSSGVDTPNPFVTEQASTYLPNSSSVIRTGARALVLLSVVVVVVVVVVLLVVVLLLPFATLCNQLVGAQSISSSSGHAELGEGVPNATRSA
jgi:hypothetical protein